jgi:hypothetical protein
MAVAGTDSLAGIRPVRLVHLVLGLLLHQQPIDDGSPGSIGNRWPAPITLEARRLSDVVNVALASRRSDQDLCRWFERIRAAGVGGLWLLPRPWLVVTGLPPAPAPGHGT